MQLAWLGYPCHIRWAALKQLDRLLAFVRVTDSYLAWHRAAYRYALGHTETEPRDHRRVRGNLLPQVEIQSVVIGFRNLGLGTGVLKDLNSSDSIAVRYWLLWQSSDTCSFHREQI